MNEPTGVLYLIAIVLMLASWLPFVPMLALWIGWLFFVVGFASDLYHNYYKDGR
ncbi:hypothetical protein M199_gp137 [Halogranum tailed virus 1]|uniref:Uncharacterized protein n=1 Tax=Halogranum tailed virus 1 TaxID=1273749 RepID=R4T726_9CAUD|nr:hypothetical protein M199_gp137 [Halogranum tailed virus 1]AGM11529.1 hypothetical protein HGTV1_232 [Halogranum tailed virus 1]